ncbi:MAG TPA: TMEM175 family protein [Candidatus Kapabacteria bacterium]|nr:TMEM175 family protein [Candidatus Kapabacteria bacterium]
MQEETGRPVPAGSETGRVEAFSDGVFAIAITLLVLDLKVPREIADGHLAEELLHLWPSYMAFLASFLTIGVMWINHHRLFTLIRRCDHTLLILNGLLLLGVTVVPFPTGLVAGFLGRPDARIAAMVYNGTFVLLAVFFNVLWRHASHNNRLFDPGADREAIRGITRQYMFGPVYYLAACLLALISVPASLGFNILLAFFFALPGVHLHGRRPG